MTNDSPHRIGRKATYHALPEIGPVACIFYGTCKEYVYGEYTLLLFRVTARKNEYYECGTLIELRSLINITWREAQ
jgi:hypothetical protein